MHNGLYRVNFQAPHGSGDGVLVIRDGKVAGGDSTMFYTGTIETRGPLVRAQLSAAVLGGDHARRTLFGVTSLILILTGFVEDGGPIAARLSGTSHEAPGVKFDAELQLLALDGGARDGAESSRGAGSPAAFSWPFTLPTVV